MEIGIGISRVGLCVSQKKASGISSEMVFGFDLTKPSRLSAAQDTVVSIETNGEKYRLEC